MTTTAWFNPFSGVAGDMALGACIDAGAELDDVIAVLDGLRLPGWGLTAEPVLRGGIAATYVRVHAEETPVTRTAEHIHRLIADADLPDRVRDRAQATVTALAAAEGRLHRRPPSQVHFHEVGGIDAIIDVVGTCAALELLDVDTVVCAPVATGVGMTRSQHGVIPIPAPAVVELLRGRPVRHVDVPHELTTPTGAALMVAVADRWGALPAMTIDSSGYGAGTRDLDGRVNAVQLVVGTAAALRIADDDGHPMVEVAVNVDDATGETLAHAVSAMLATGAADAWVAPVLMKKGRPGHVVTALCDEASAPAVAATVTAETGSFGVRVTPVRRWAARRHFDEVDVDGHRVRVKVTDGRTKVEHDDAADAARATGRPLREVVSLAEEAARRRSGAVAPGGADGEATSGPGGPFGPRHLGDVDPDEPA